MWCWPWLVGAGRESLAGGLLGLLLIPLAGSVPGLAPRSLNAFGLIMGGIVGAMLVTYVYRFPRLLCRSCAP